MLKAGRHERGSKAASTHTGALVGSDEVFDAALERAGVVRAMTFGQLFAAAEMLSDIERVGGNRLAIVTNGGGAGVLATDRAEDLGIALAELEPKTVAALDKLLPPYWSHAQSRRHPRRRHGRNLRRGGLRLPRRQECRRRSSSC